MSQVPISRDAESLDRESLASVWEYLRRTDEVLVGLMERLRIAGAEDDLSREVRALADSVAEAKADAERNVRSRRELMERRRSLRAELVKLSGANSHPEYLEERRRELKAMTDLRDRLSARSADLEETEERVRIMRESNRALERRMLSTRSAQDELRALEKRNSLLHRKLSSSLPWGHHVIETLRDLDSRKGMNEPVNSRDGVR